MLTVRVEPIENDTLLINEWVRIFNERGDSLRNKGWIEEAEKQYQLAKWLDELISLKNTFSGIEKARFDILSGMVTIPSIEADMIFNGKEDREDYIRKTIASGMRDLLAENLSVEKVDNDSGTMIDRYRGYICMMRRKESNR